MGILNVTPDSFSDGGRFFDPRRAIAHAASMAAEGADIIDIGAESTRPYGGAAAVSADDEIARLAPTCCPRVVGAWHAGLDRHHEGRGRATGRSKPAPPSSTTSGACSATPTWRASSPSTRVPVIVMHNREQRRPGDRHLADIEASSRARSRSPTRAGMRREQIVLDPGIGFGKTPEQSIDALAQLRTLEAIRPAAAGRRVAQALHRSTIVASEPDERLGGSIASHLLAVDQRRRHRARP